MQRFHTDMTHSCRKSTRFNPLKKTVTSKTFPIETYYQFDPKWLRLNGMSALRSWHSRHQKPNGQVLSFSPFSSAKATVGRNWSWTSTSMLIGENRGKLLRSRSGYNYVSPLVPPKFLGDGK
ncbi:hypothetical protein KIN20_019430 [Parelaphostrongylus tenuis]|uniref:Uncharacterized protein n=1 Tax=Parelaphostrongylus tenuis TaxID=148309 RepID=A0AAD5MPI9_PARTN|nr:hypothetical protein KIN20_019430 [Parelaphostrongylus tenuis]